MEEYEPQQQRDWYEELLLTPLHFLKEAIVTHRETIAHLCRNPPSKLIILVAQKNWLHMLENIVSDYDTEHAIKRRRIIELKWLINDCEHAMGNQSLDTHTLGSITQTLITVTQAQEELDRLEGRIQPTTDISSCVLSLVCDTHNTEASADSHTADKMYAHTAQT
jgi:hypothetical protein